MARRRRLEVKDDPGGEVVVFGRYRLMVARGWSREFVEALGDEEIAEELGRLDAEREEETGGEAA